MKIENRLTVNLLIIFLLLGMVGLLGLVATKKIVSSFVGSDKEVRATVSSALEVGILANCAETHIVLYLLLNDEQDKRKYFLCHDSMVEQIAYLEKHLHAPDALKILADIKGQSDLVLPIGVELIRLHQEDMKSDGRFIGARHVNELRKLYTVSSSLRKLGNKLVQYNIAVEEDKQARIIEDAQVLQRYIIILFLVAFVLMVILAYRLTRSILKPLLYEISERRQTEEALQQSESYYRAIVEDQAEFICRFRDNGTITFVNEACCTYFEQRSDELLQQKFISFFPSADQDKVEKSFKQLSVEHPMVDYMTEIELPTGERRWHHWTLRLILDRDNEPFEFQAVGRDITEQKDLEQKIQGSAEKIKFFAYSVSHDLKNPAINIYGLTKILKNNYKELLDDKGQNFCDQIMSSSEQVTALVDKINQYITTAETPLHLERVDLIQVLSLILDEFSAQFNQRNIQWNLPEIVPDIRIDRLAFIRVMRNLIDNALKYGGEDLSEISIGYEGTDQYHVLSISNNGVGIQEENYEKVFGVFEREQRGRKVEGAGLGLAIVKEMTERHKGRAWIGPYKDEGVTFYISISKFL